MTSLWKVSSRPEAKKRSCWTKPVREEPLKEFRFWERGWEEEEEREEGFGEREPSREME
jgi:hypothetical protein